MTIHTQIFLALALNSLACLGIHCVTRDGMVFGPIAEYIRALVGDFSAKPLFDCPPCMASVWGFLGWFYLTPGLALLPYLLVLCGVNALISKLYYYGD